MAFVQQFTFPQEIDASLRITSLLLQNVIDRDVLFELEMGFMPALKDVLPFILIDQDPLHNIRLGTKHPFHALRDFCKTDFILIHFASVVNLFVKLLKNSGAWRVGSPPDTNEF